MSNWGIGRGAFQTLPVSGGGTGGASAVAYEVVCGGTISTNPFQQVLGTGTNAYVLTSNGTGTLPTWQPAMSGGLGAIIITSGLTPITVSGSGFTPVFDFTGYTACFGMLQWTQNGITNTPLTVGVNYISSRGVNAGSTDSYTSNAGNAAQFAGALLKLQLGAGVSNVYWVLTLFQLA